MTRRFGTELEFGDLLTVDAARAIFESQGLDFETWRDRHRSDNSRKVRDYTKWNVQSDGTIRNSDGSRCMISRVSETGELVRAKWEEWQGGEIISPIYTNLVEWSTDIELMIGSIESLGAQSKPELRQGFHVHVEIEDWVREDYDNFMKWYLQNQDLLREVLVSYRDGQYYGPRSVYTQGQLDLFLQAKDEDLWTVYRARRDLDTLFTENSQDYRRMVCISPALDPRINQKTLEWRIWPSSFEVDKLEEFVELSIEWTQNLPTEEQIRKRLYGT